MKIIHISNFYANFKGSFINQLEVLAQRIKESKYEIIFIFPQEAKKIGWCKDLITKYKVYFVSVINGSTEKEVISELKNIFEIEKPDIIHSHFDGYDVAVTKAADEKVIKVYHRHNEFDISNLKFHKKLFALISIKIKMNYIKSRGYQVFTSQDMMNKFINKKYALRERAKVIINGISTRCLENENENIEKRDKPIIFSLIGNWERKGGDILFKAIEKLNSKEIKVYLSSIIDREFIKEKMGYIPQWLISLNSTDDMKKYYSMSDMFVSSSRKETFSYALAEAIYCKLACISSDIDGVQWSKKIPTVKFFKNESIDELESKIYESLDKKYSDEAYETSKAIIRNQYSEYTWSSNVIKMYSELIG